MKAFSEIGVWSAQSGRYERLARLAMDEGTLRTERWYRGGVLYGLHKRLEGDQSIYYGRPGKPAKLVLSGSVTKLIRSYTSPNGLHGLILDPDPEKGTTRVWPLTPEGDRGEAIEIPVVADDAHLDNNGTVGITFIVENRLEWKSIDLARRTVSDKEPSLAETEGVRLPFEIVSIENKIEGATAPTTALLMRVGDGRAPETSALLSGDAKQENLSPDGRYVAYLSDGIALVREIAAIDATALDALRRGQAQTKAMNEAKQAARAAIMYAYDHDDEMVSGADWAAKLAPYSRSVDVLSNFTLLLNGGNLTKIQNPETVQLGFVSTRYGRAIAFADGHVRWFPAP
jgi:prepilin-type processing-associated H-X9-DG protein